MARLMRLFGLVVVSFLCMVGVEAGYRIFLFYERPQEFLQTVRQVPSLVFYNESPWQFNERYGFDYVTNGNILAAAIVDGALQGCTIEKTNAEGSWGTIEGNYASAQYKALLFGNSFSGQAEQGLTWNTFLQRELSNRLGKTVHVSNFARDGEGLLQMLDVAAGESARLHPDLVIIAFTTDGFEEGRIWRRVEIVDGRRRVFTLPTPDFDLRHAADTAIIDPDPAFTERWCAKQPPPSRDTDPIIREVETRYRLATKLADARADLFSWRYSAALDRIMHNDPFFRAHNESRAAPSVHPRHNLTDFSQDRRAVDDIAAIRATGARIMLFHMATRTEMRAGKEYLAISSTDQALLSSLETLLGTRTVTTHDNIAEPADVENIGRPDGDDHPSLYGMQFYADVAMRGLVTGGYLAANDLSR